MKLSADDEGRGKPTGADVARRRLVAVTGRERLLSDPGGDWALPGQLAPAEPTVDGVADDVDGAPAWDETDAELARALRQAGATAPLPQDETPADHPVWRFAREHMGVLLVVLAVAVVFAIVQATRSRPEAVASPSVAVVASGSAAASASPAANPASPSVVPIKVHVLGAVASPGVVTLAPGSRVEDALAAAGGLRGDADPAQLNLAAVVADGAQIVIGTKQDPQGQINGTEAAGAGAATGAASGAVINLNTASQAQLEQLPGVGPVTAQKIIAWRDQNKRFTSVSELQEVDGIGPKTFAQLEPYVTV
ncbi:MAG: helix-hairpin-helix domain-containing protein [Propionibacteriaceae bacterium]|nr:helix-hairpin-helix domain-containing protein [Propionibacteriaceae bacterium]